MSKLTKSQGFALDALHRHVIGIVLGGASEVFTDRRGEEHLYINARVANELRRKGLLRDFTGGPRYQSFNREVCLTRQGSTLAKERARDLKEHDHNRKEAPNG